MNTLSTNLTPILAVLGLIGGVYLIATGHQNDGWLLIVGAGAGGGADGIHRYNNTLPDAPAAATPTPPKT